MNSRLPGRSSACWDRTATATMCSRSQPPLPLRRSLRPLQSRPDTASFQRGFSQLRMNEAVSEFVEAAVRRYDEELNRAGFRTKSCGDRTRTGRGGTRRAWARRAHRQLDGRLSFAAPKGGVASPCRNRRLAPDGGRCPLSVGHTLMPWGDLPWLDAAGLLLRVEQWIRNAADGWVADAPSSTWRHTTAPASLLEGPECPANTHHRQVGRNRRPLVPSHTADGHGSYGVEGYPRRTPPAPPSVRSRRRRRVGGKPDRFVNGIAVDLGEMTHP